MRVRVRVRVRSDAKLRLVVRSTLEPVRLLR